jgi:alkylation response protein AidB-like acyl-CoA dehydrogenase
MFIAECANRLADDIAHHRPEMLAARRMPDALAKRLADAGLFRMLVPREFGGGEAAPPVFVETLSALARIDASTAWCVMIGATSGLSAARLDADAAREIFGDPSAIVTGVFAPMGRAAREGDVYRVSGHWRWNSAGLVSTWLGGGCLIEESGKPKPGAGGAAEHRMLFFPAAEATFVDTWHTNGLRGTGSGDMKVATSVPVRRVAALIGEKPRIARPLYAFPVFGLLAVGISAVASGNALGALSEFAAMANSRRTPGGRTMAERGTVAALYAEAFAEHAAARALLDAEVAACWHAAETAPEAELSVERRARLRLAATHLTRVSASVVRRLQDAAGGPAVFTDDALQRRLADGQVMTAHMMIAPPTCEMAGAALLGRAIDATQL